MAFSSPDCTIAAFVGIIAAVVSTLYRKRLTRLQWNISLWNEFWRYATAKTHGDINMIRNNMFMNGFNEICNSNNDKKLPEVEMFNDIYASIHINHPSHAVRTFIDGIIEQHLHNRLIRISSETPSIHCDKNTDILIRSLERDPLQILVPLCGCSYDMYYISHLLRRKYKLHPKLFKIIGIEWSLTAIINFFGNNELTTVHNRYNPRYMYYKDFYSIEIYSNIEHSIHIINDDIFSYFELCKQLKYIGIAPSLCLIEEKCIDIIIDINGMSCCDPSYRMRYMKALKYWLSDKGVLLLETYCYDAVLSNYPPYTIHPTYVEGVFNRNRCKLLDVKKRQCANKTDPIRHSWLIRR